MLTTSISSQQRLSQCTWSALAVLLLTSVHHVYGAFVYHTPWRLHVAPVAGLTAVVIVGTRLVLRRHSDDAAGRIALWAFVGITLVIPVAAIGFFEGGYNHVLKNALYFAGAPTSLMVRLFPPPTYEMPNDAFFEITGVMQALLGGVTGWLLYRLVQSRPGAPMPSLRSRRIADVSLHVNDSIARRAIASVSSGPVSIPDSHRLVHLQFRRFAGCPVCNLHLQSFRRKQSEIAAAGVREVVVFHSTTDDLRPYTAVLPFPVIADPDKRLYLEFGVESSPRALLDPRAWPSILRGIIRSAVSIVRDKRPAPSLTPRGGRFGLPADFLIAPDGRLLARKYGKHADDQWSVQEVVTLAREATTGTHVNHRSETPSARTRGTSGYLAAE